MDTVEEAGDKLFTFTRVPPSQWKSIRTPNAIERLHEEFKRGSRRKPAALRRDSRPCCSGRRSRPVRSPCERSTAGKVSPKSPSTKSLTSPLDRIASCSPETTHRIPTHSARAPDLILVESCVGEIVRAIL